MEPRCYSHLNAILSSGTVTKCSQRRDVFKPIPLMPNASTASFRVLE
nr:MAG TPA: hypothetical protein [Caudoviricetes sp.]